MIGCAPGRSRSRPQDRVGLHVHADDVHMFHPQWGAQLGEPAPSTRTPSTLTTAARGTVES